MTLLTLHQALVDDLQLLSTLSADVVSELSTLALTNLSHGHTADADKKYRRAAKALSVDPATLTAAIHALSYLLLHAAKRHTSEADFTASLPPLNLPPTHTQLLTQLYTAHSSQLTATLATLSLPLPHYVDLQWRLDVELHSRAMAHTARPVYLLELKTGLGGVGGSSAGGAGGSSVIVQSDYAGLVRLEAVLEDAIKAMQTKEARRIIRYVK